MDQYFYRTIGVIGGMGPVATVRFLELLYQCAATASVSDQDFPRVIVDSNTQIPDRTRGVLGTGESPVDAIVETATQLERCGAQVLCMPCNTAHAFFDEIQSRVETPIINMIEATADEVKNVTPDARRVGVLCTTGARQARVYDECLIARGMAPVYVRGAMQNALMHAIYALKRGFDHKAAQTIQRAIEELTHLQADVIVLGCTELALGVSGGAFESPVLIVDSNEALARSVVARARVSARRNVLEHDLRPIAAVAAA